MAASKPQGQVTLTQMLKALDKRVASGVERKLKKLSKKKAIQKPLDRNKAELVERQAGYADVSKAISQWEPVVEHNRKARQLKFPLDQQPDVLPASADCLASIKPSTEFELEMRDVLELNDRLEFVHKSAGPAPMAAQAAAEAAFDEQPRAAGGPPTRGEQNYLKSVGVEEAEERHKELQRMRVLLGSYAAKMKRQKSIKSKSYRRLLKQERLRAHMKKVESSGDMLMSELEQLQRLRARERASLKHKNTGKWAKHAKFRAKYDESARNAMIEQIGIAKKLTQRPPGADSDDSDESRDSEESADELASDSESLGAAGERQKAPLVAPGGGGGGAASGERLIVSSELIEQRAARKRKAAPEAGGDLAEEAREGDEGDEGGEGDEADEADEADEQRRLMSEAFADDDVVAEFQRAKDELLGEEQPKALDLFLPGWGGWAGAGIRADKRKRARFLVKPARPARPARRDDNLGNVIISEQADNKLRDLMVKSVPRGFRGEAHLERALSRPTAGTFIDQAAHRRAVRPRVHTKMGARIEPMSERALPARKAKWAR